MTQRLERRRSGPSILAPVSDRGEEGSDAAAGRIRELVRKAQGGEADAFGVLYSLYHEPIFRLARLHAPEAADDVASEVFVRAWRGLPRYRDVGKPFLAWLYGIAHHVLSDELAKRRRERSRSDLPDRVSAWAEDDRLAIAQAMEGLPGDQRRVLEMKFFLGMRNPEVASILGKTIGAVNALQWRGLGAMRETLERE